VEGISHEFSRHKEQAAKRPSFDEYLFVKEATFSDRVQEIEEKISDLGKRVA
jgi:hypothetical protein